MKCRPIRLITAAVLIAAIAPLCASEREASIEGGLQGALQKYVEPAYPLALLTQGITRGFVMVWIAVDPSGSLIDAYATEFSNERFAQSSLDAVGRWEFKPDSTGSSLPRLFSVRLNFTIAGMVVVEVHASDAVDRGRSLIPNRPVFESYSFDDLDSIPDAINAPLPTYPEALKAGRKSGRVEVLFHVDKTGRVRVPLVTHSDDPLFAEAAMAAVAKWTFEVPRRSGRPASAFTLQRFTFGPRPESNG